MTTLRCPLDGFHLRRGRGQTRCNSEKIHALPAQSPVVSGASERTKSPGCFSARLRVDLIFLDGKEPHSPTRRAEGCKPASYSRPQRLLRPQQGTVNHLAVPPGNHGHAFVIRPTGMISHPSETLRPPVPVISPRQRSPPPLHVNIWLCSDLWTRWAKKPSPVWLQRRTSG